jgi:hypothetical protein
MLSFGRSKAKSNLKWTRAKFIKESVSQTINSADNYVAVCDMFGSEIAEIFSVRNHAAHRSPSSRQEFNAVVQRVYGRSRNISLGTFLISPQIVVMPNLPRYIGEIRVIVKEIVKK